MLQLSLARNYEARQQTDKALLICESLLKQDSLRVDVLKFKAGLLAKKGNNDAAVLTLEKAYQLVPYDVELNYMLALKYAENRDPKALRLCDSLARADSEEVHAEPFYYKGIYYAAVNDKANAIASFNEAISHDYNFLDAYIEKAAVLVDQKKYAEAIKTLELALTISPGFADAYYWLGKSYEAMGNREDAGLNYRKALGLDPMLKEAKEGIERVK
jgi:tetratricopeptide (TPR) repeat protein